MPIEVGGRDFNALKPRALGVLFTDRGIYPVGGGALIPFRRTTDYVMCDSCLRTYDVRSLMARAETAEAIESLERLAEKVEEAEQG